VVALPARLWRAWVGPALFLLAATIAIGVVRVEMRHHTTPPRPQTHHRTAAPAAKKAFYAVHAGDTLGSIAAKTHVPVATLQHLNPNVQPTALFLGEKLRIR
jgi:Tfp pilus assembly protein FimV